MAIRKILKRTLLSLLGLVALVLLGIAFLLNFIFTPEKITPQALALLNSSINAKVDGERLELTFFSSFPYLKANLTNGHLAPRQNTQETIGSFQEFSGIINVRQLLFHQQIIIKKAVITAPKIRLLVDKNGQPNWDILHPATDTITDTSASDFTINKISIKELIIEKAAIQYDDSSTQVHLKIPELDLQLSAEKDSQKIALTLTSSGKNISFLKDNIQFVKHLSTQLTTELLYDKITKTLFVHKGDLLLNDFDFDIKGSIAKHPTRQQLSLDLHSSLRIHSLDSLWKFIPASFLPLDSATIAGTADLELSCKGNYGEGDLPVSTARLKIQNGKLTYANFPGKIDELDAEIHSFLDFKSPQLSRLTIQQLHVKGTGLSLDAQATVERLLTDPIINGEIRADMDLTQIKTVYPLDKSIHIKGQANLNLEGSVHYNMVKGIDYNNLDLEGDLQLKTLDIRLKNDSIRFHTGLTKLTAKRATSESLAAHLSADSIYADYYHTQQLQLKTLSFDFKKNDGKRNRYPINATIAVREVHYLGPDSLKADFHNAGLQVNMRPNEDFAASAIQSAFTIQKAAIHKGKLAASGKEDYYNFYTHQLSLSDLSAKLMHRQRANRQRSMNGQIAFQSLRYHSSDSLRARIRKASIEATMRPEKGDTIPTIATNFHVQHISLKKDKQLFAIKDGQYDLRFKKDSTRDWWPNGSVSFSKLSAYLPAVGMPLSIEESSIGVSNHSVKLDQAIVRAGHSKFRLSGDVDNLYPHPDSNLQLQASLQLHAEYIDANEIMQSIHKSAASAQSYDSVDDVPVIDTLEASTAEKSLFELPNDVQLAFVLSIDSLRYGHLMLEKIAGKAKLDNGKLIIPNVQFQSKEALVQAQLRYVPVNSKTARINYSLKLQDLEMSHLKDLAPALDTLFPVAKQMEGKANFTIKGMALLNEQLEPDMKSVKSVALLEAHHIRVGDSEAFRELAKTFMFKNKEKTEIDSLNVEMLISDNRLEVLPALVEIDRYQLAVGGIQNMDLSYTYHVSVLKSQIPFKAGVDINGTMPTFNINLTKAKYKYFFSDKARQQDKADKSILEKKKFILDRLGF